MPIKKKCEKNPSEHHFKGNDGILRFASGEPLMAECIELISDILKAENYEEKTCPFDKEMALNLDRVEIKKKKGSIIRKSKFSPNPKRSVRKLNCHIKRSVLKTISAQRPKCNQKELHFGCLPID